MEKKQNNLQNWIITITILIISLLADNFLKP